MSRCSRSPSLIPTASARTTCERRPVDLIAISAAIHPPNDTTRKDHVAQVERVHDIEVEIGKIVDRGHGARQLAAPEARMGRRDHRKRSGKLLDRAVGRFDPDRGVQQQQGLSGPALDEFDANSCYVGQSVYGFDAVEHGRDHLGRTQCGLISAALTSSLFCLIWARKKASNSDEVISKGCPPNAVSLSCTLLICSAFAVSR